MRFALGETDKVKELIQEGRALTVGGLGIEEELEHSGQPGLAWQHGLKSREPWRVLTIQSGSAVLYTRQANLE
jgi:hypothetical protein